MNKVTVKNISEDKFNPFEASAEELIAMALYDAGLTNDFTRIDDQPVDHFLETYFKKRTVFREITRLGKLLMEEGKLTNEKIKQALKHQAKHPYKKIGEILVQMSLCKPEDIDACLNNQKKKRAQRSGKKAETMRKT